MGGVKLEHPNVSQHQVEIVQQMREFWTEKQFCDVVLKDHEGTEHRAHIALLSATSVYFRKLFGGSFLEADLVQRKEPVEIAASKAAMSAFLDYIYGGQPEVDVETGLELLRLAQAYDLPKFASAIEAGLRASLDSVKALRILQETPLLPSLKAACEEKVAEDFETCTKRPDFGKLSAHQLSRILKRPDLCVSREEAVLQGIFNWLKISNDRRALLGMLLQHVDFQSFSVDNLLRISRLNLSGPSAAELHQDVDEALQIRQGKRAQSVQSSEDYQPKRRCLKHWTPDLGASTEALQGVLPRPCFSLSWHKGHIYASDTQGNVLCWKPGDPATSARKVVGRTAGTTGISDLGGLCQISISPNGEIFVLDLLRKRLVRFQDGCGHLVCGNLNIAPSGGIFCSPNGVVYVLADKGKVVQKLVGSMLETIIASESLQEDLQFFGTAIFVTKDEEIYIADNLKGWTRVLRFNPSESLEPVVVGESFDDGPASKPCGLFITEGKTIYVAALGSAKVLAFRPGDTTPSEVFRCPNTFRPFSLLVRDRSLYVSMLDGREHKGVHKHLLPPELQLEWKSRFTRASHLSCKWFGTAIQSVTLQPSL